MKKGHFIKEVTKMTSNLFPRWISCVAADLVLFLLSTPSKVSMVQCGGVLVRPGPSAAGDY